MEKRPGIALAFGFLHGLLMREEGGALSEEHREGTQPDLFHGILRIGARATIRKRRHQLVQLPHELIKAFQAHGRQSLARKSAVSGHR